MDESLPRVIYDKLPIFAIQPSVAKAKASEEEGEQGQDGAVAGEIYECPVYKTTDRHGFMTTTGHSTNFVMRLELPSSKYPPSHFIMRGCAAFCQLDN